MKLAAKIIIGMIASPFVLGIVADYGSRISEASKGLAPTVLTSVSPKPSVKPIPVDRFDNDAKSLAKSDKEDARAESEVMGSVAIRDYSPGRESLKKTEPTSIDPEMWTSQNPNAKILSSTQVSSMDGTTVYSTLQEGQLVKLTGSVVDGKAGIEIDYAIFKTQGYISLADVAMLIRH